MAENFDDERPRILVLASGGGTTAAQIVRDSVEGIVSFEVGEVLCNNPPEVADVYSLFEDLNSELGTSVNVRQVNERVVAPDGSEFVKPPKGVQGDHEAEEILRTLEEGGYCHLALLGYMKKLRADIFKDWVLWPDYEGDEEYLARSSNTHHGKLKETEGCYGQGIDQRVKDLGLTSSAFMLQLVGPEYDVGPVIWEAQFPVLPHQEASQIQAVAMRVEKSMIGPAIDRYLLEQAEWRAR